MSNILLPLSNSDQRRFDKNLPSRPAEPDACWQWKHGHPTASYRFWLQGETRYPHLVAWVISKGPIPDCLQVLRTCSNPRCCRVSHMELGNASRTTERNMASRFFVRTSPGEKLPNMETACINWTGSPDTEGYGVMQVGGKQKKAHQVAWFLRYEVWIPRPELIMHRCDVRKCVNIEHLKLGDNVKNREDCVQKGRQAKGPTHGSKTQPESVPKGEKNGRAKITFTEVIQIRLTVQAHPAVHGLLEGLARKFNLDSSTIREIADHLLWPHVKNDDVPGLKPIPLSELQFGHHTGEKSPFAKVSDASIKLIRAKYAAAERKHGLISQLAQEFGLSISHVSRIVHGESR